MTPEEVFNDFLTQRDTALAKDEIIAEKLTHIDELLDELEKKLKELKEVSDETQDIISIICNCCDDGDSGTGSHDK